MIGFLSVHLDNLPYYDSVKEFTFFCSLYRGKIAQILSDKDFSSAADQGTPITDQVDYIYFQLQNRAFFQVSISALLLFGGALLDTT